MLNCNNELSSFRNFIAEFSREILILFFRFVLQVLLCVNTKIDQTELTVFSFGEFSLC
jgi:hypothetical protein